MLFAGRLEPHPGYRCVRRAVDTPAAAPTLAATGRTAQGFHGRQAMLHITTAATRRSAAGLALMGLLFIGGAAPAQQANDLAARIERFKTAVIGGVEARKKLSQVINDTVFSYGELAYQEFE